MKYNKHMIQQIPPGRICCIDFGLKRIGIALSNKSKTLATKFALIENKGFNHTKLFLTKAISEQEITSFLLGWPLTLNGDQGDQCKLVDNFSNKLSDAFQLPIYRIDERNSTKQCQIMHQSKVTDDIVASMLLQEFLNQCS